MHKSSMKNMERFRNLHLAHVSAEPLTIADIGSMNVNGCYRDVLANPHWRYTGVDMEAGDNVDVILDDLYRWGALETGHYDVVVSGQAFEHIEFFWESMREIARILRPGGLCCLIAPSGGFEHRYPVDCWRFYPDGMRALARYAGLETVEAYAEWDQALYPNRDPTWQDCVLVARKPGALSPIATSQPATSTIQAVSAGQASYHVTRSLSPTAGSLLLRCHLDHPSHQQDEALDGNGRLRISGWVLGRHWQPSTLCIGYRDKGEEERHAIDRERGDVIQKILHQEHQGHPRLRCGFDVRVRAADRIRIGFEVAGNQVDGFDLRRDSASTPAR